MKQKMIIILICVILLSYWVSMITNQGITSGQQNSTIEIKSRSRGTIIVDCQGNGDYNTIQEAIVNASSGDTIRVWAGNYEGGFKLDKTLSLIGNGSNVTTIAAPYYSYVIKIKADYCNISSFKIGWADGLDWFHGGIEIESKYNKIENCYFIRNDFGIIVWEYNINYNNNIINNCSFNKNDGGIWIWPGNDNNTINNSIFNDTFYGIRIVDSDNNSISYCVFSNNFWCGVHLVESKKNSIENSTFNNNSWGIYLTNSNNNEIVNCRWINNTGGISLQSSNFNHIFNCNLDENLNSPIWLNYSSFNLINNCSCRYSKEGFCDYGDVGISLNKICN